MPADFFQRQAEYRAKSRRFFAAFVLSVALALAVFYLAVSLCLSPFLALNKVCANPDPVICLIPLALYGSTPSLSAARPALIIGLWLIALITLTARKKILSLKKGGAAAAALLDGRLLEEPLTIQEERLFGVVEEMAVAAGLPRPALFILEKETAINAVTAGRTPGDAALILTAGAVERLNRDELQAVVAHEFAHILNGDCALNLTMAGWLHGLLSFYAAGVKFLVLVLDREEDWDFIRRYDPKWADLIKEQRGSLRRRYGRLTADDLLNPANIFMLIWGLILKTGGRLGKLSAELTQAALSRSREYLADAFAVQFTRNPEALAGALKKIARRPERGLIGRGQAEIMKSFFLVSPGAGLFRCHPPLSARILAITPDWDGNWPEAEKISPPVRRPAKNLEKLKARHLDWAGVSLLALAGDQAGPAPNLAEAGRRLYLSLPASLREAARLLSSSPVLAAAVFIQNEAPGLAAKIIGEALGPGAAAQAIEWSRLMPDGAKLPLLELAAPTLRRLPPETQSVLWRLIKKLIAADGRLSLFEVAGAQILKKSLNLKLAGSPRPAPAGSLAARLRSDAALFLSALAHVGAEGQNREEAARAAFQEAAKLFADCWTSLAFTPRERLKTRDILPLLDRLGQAPEKIKGRLAAAAVACALHDGVITPKEYELTRALAAALDFNLPLKG